MAPELYLRATLLALGCAALVGVRAQPPSCKLFVHGTFLLPGDHAGEEMKLIRHGNTQKEIGKDGHRSQYRVRWVDECTYLLYDRKVKRGVEKHPSSPTDTLTVHILDTWEYGYAYRATSNFSTHEVQGTLEMVVPKGYGGITIGF
jgi:hypothetical protein